jgi:RHS repeat-associated protein
MHPQIIIANPFIPYSFNGMEKDNEVKGDGNCYTTEFRQYDPRIGRWLTVDPKASKYPYESPFVAFHNNPILYNDPRGDDPPEELIGEYSNLFRKAWGESFQGEKRISGEVGGVLIKVKTSTEVNGVQVESYAYEVHNYEITKQGYVRISYKGLPENAEVVGNFHTHPYDDKETKSIRKYAPDFSPSAVPFSSGDFTSYSTDIRNNNIGNGDVNFVVTETAIYGLTIDDTKQAQKFLERAASVLADKEVDLMNGTVKPTEGESFNSKQYQMLIEIQQNYESETGEKSGVTFSKTDIKTEGDEEN